MTVYEKLMQVQKELKAPKNQYNSFGKYHYRSAEDILEAAKPICIKNGLVLMLSDTVEMAGPRIYVKSTASVVAAEDNQMISVSAYAREADEKKGMDSSQITGAASSYARKYALNGLFCIDDTKDADTDEYSANSSEKQYRCNVCNKIIMGVKKPDGTMVSAETVYNSCGGKCLSCYKQQKNTEE